MPNAASNAIPRTLPRIPTTYLLTGSGSAASIEYQFNTGDAELDRLVIQIRAARLAAQRLEARVQHLTSRVLILPSGGSVRDLALLVGLSHQSVHRLMRLDSNSGDTP